MICGNYGAGKIRHGLPDAALSNAPMPPSTQLDQDWHLWTDDWNRQAMAATSIEDWLRLDPANDEIELPHRCKRLVQEWSDGDQTYVKCRADDGTVQTHRLVTMSSLSRRACYKCGNVGHYAEVCSSAERLCYNCKQPGHESNQCPLPRTTEAKQCYHCQGLGHVQADCPTLRLSGAGTSGRCYNCGQPGHLARACPNPSGVGAMGRGGPVARGGYGGGFGRGGGGGFNGPRPATCYKCGGPNHFARDCQAQAMKCYACGKLGHISRDCTAPNGGPLNTAGKTCYQCGEAGHISRDCPQKNTAGEMGGPADVDMTAPAAAPAIPPVA